MDPQPILVIKFPPFFTREEFTSIKSKIESTIGTQYWVLFVPTTKLEEFEFQLLSVTDADEKEFKELTDELMKIIENHERTDH